MRTKELYERYTVPPQLQEHMLRVTAIASIICDNFSETLQKDIIIRACLLHDIGNIVKFNLDAFPEFLQDKGKEYWQKVQQSFREKYGNDDHEVTRKICEELHVDESILAIIDSFGFAKAEKTLKEPFARQIGVYSDMRVSPSGVSSLEERLSEAKLRYTSGQNAKYTPEEFDRLAGIWQEIENKIFAHCSVKPEEINDRTVVPMIEQMRNYDLI